jgi:hypothetical protein
MNGYEYLKGWVHVVTGNPDITKPKLFFFEKKNETEPKPGQTDRFRFGLVFWAKTSSNRFGSVFPVWLGFFPVFYRFRFGLVFSVFCL